MSEPFRWRTWLQLLRAPNLFTVPGDPLAGFLLASRGHVDYGLALVIGASLCFYSHGLLLNDLADLAEDRRDRPTRPLPSGAARPRTVLIVALVLALVALVLCFTIGSFAVVVGFALLVAIVLYNLWFKKVAILGPINMGLCRGLSVLLGASAGTYAWIAQMPPSTITTVQHGSTVEMYATSVVVRPDTPHVTLLVAFGVTLYIAAITNLARIETHERPPKLPRVLPFFALLVILVPFFLASVDRTQPLRYSNIWLYLISGYTLYAGYQIHTRLIRQPPPPIPATIGQLIRLLLPLQAAYCVASRSFAGGVAAALLILLWPISRSVSKRFYAS